MEPHIKTHYAPAFRRKKEDIAKMNKNIIETPFLEAVFNKLPYLLMLLNQERQLVFCNTALLGFLSLRDYNEILSHRPGEIFNCIHSQENEGGCGTSKSCEYCGAVNALLKAQKSQKIEKHECRILRNSDGNQNYFSLMVTVYPYKIENSIYYLFFLEDLSDLKRKEQLEVTFLHDFANVFVILNGYIETFPQKGLNGDQIKNLEEIKKISAYISEDIRSQQDLNMLKFKNIAKNPVQIQSIEILQESINLAQVKFGTDRFPLTIDPNSNNVSFQSDRAILRRILLNLLKNAYEASTIKEKITTGVIFYSGKLTFWVHNIDFIPPDIQMQLFNFGFSTKGKGRGIGLYSSKLLTEQILLGTLKFESTIEKGTTFYVILDDTLKSTTNEG